MKFWLIITKISNIYRKYNFRALKTKPKRLTLSEVAVEVTITIRDEWFQRPSLTLNLDVNAPVPVETLTLKPLEIEQVLRQAGFAVKIVKEDDENENKISM